MLATMSNDPIWRDPGFWIMVAWGIAAVVTTAIALAVYDVIPVWWR